MARERLAGISSDDALEDIRVRVRVCMADLSGIILRIRAAACARTRTQAGKRQKADVCNCSIFRYMRLVCLRERCVARRHDSVAWAYAQTCNQRHRTWPVNARAPSRSRSCALL